MSILKYFSLSEIAKITRVENFSRDYSRIRQIHWRIYNIKNIPKVFKIYRRKKTLELKLIKLSKPLFNTA